MPEISPPPPPTVYAEPIPESVVDATGRLEDACQAWGKTQIREGVVASDSYGSICDTVIHGDVTNFMFWFGVIAGLLVGWLFLAPVVQLLIRGMSTLISFVVSRATRA